MGSFCLGTGVGVGRSGQQGARISEHLTNLIKSCLVSAQRRALMTRKEPFAIGFSDSTHNKVL